MTKKEQRKIVKDEIEKISELFADTSILNSNNEDKEIRKKHIEVMLTGLCEMYHIANS